MSPQGASDPSGPIRQTRRVVATTSGESSPPASATMRHRMSLVVADPLPEHRQRAAARAANAAPPEATIAAGCSGPEASVSRSDAPPSRWTTAGRVGEEDVRTGHGERGPLGGRRQGVGRRAAPARELEPGHDPTGDQHGGDGERRDPTAPAARGSRRRHRRFRLRLQRLLDEPGVAPPARSERPDDDLLELVPGRVRVAGSLAGVLGQQPLDPARQRRVDVRFDRRQRPEGLADVLEHHHERLVRLGERQRAADHLVGHDPDCVEVRPGADVLAARLFGRHVGRRTDRHARVRGQRVAERLDGLGDPEVGDLHAPVRGHHHVLGLEVAVDDSGRVGRGQAGQHPFEHAGRLREGQPPHDGPERSALEPLHGDIAGALVLEELVDGDDIRMAERPGQPRLAEEALDAARIGGVKRGELLERHVAVEVGLPGQVDERHAAPADLTEQLVAPDGARHGAGHGGKRTAV